MLKLYALRNHGLLIIVIIATCSTFFLRSNCFASDLWGMVGEDVVFQGTVYLFLDFCC